MKEIIDKIIEEARKRGWKEDLDWRKANNILYGVQQDLLKALTNCYKEKN